MANNEVKEMLPWMINFRRDLHAHPELSFKEFETTNKIINELNKINNIEIIKPFKTGCAAVLKGKYPGKKILLRADIDALPIEEDNNLAYRSLNKGVMHACGHDGHTAMLLAALKILANYTDILHGEAVFLFQHAEELPPGGAIEWAAYGIMDDVDELYGLHLSSSYPTGKFGIRAGALTSATDRFDIIVQGRGGHSAYPETSIDPIVLASEVILALQTIVARRIKATEPAVISSCMIEAGEAYNIIPDEVKITGSIRTFSNETREKLPGLMEEMIKGICIGQGGDAVFKFSKGYASVINDYDITIQTEALIKKIFGQDATFEIEPLMPGEDYSALQGKAESFFVELGARNEKKGIIYPHHNGRYLMDENALPYGLTYWLNLVIDRLK